MQYTTKEKMAINDAWRKLVDYLECRSIRGATDIKAWVKEEIRQSRSLSFNGFSQAEARLYVMREFSDGVAIPDRQAHQIEYMKPQLILAFVFGAHTVKNLSERNAAAFHEVMEAINAARAAHGCAFDRYMNRPRTKSNAA